MKALFISLLIISVISWISMINEIENYFQSQELNTPKTLKTFLTDFLWDSEYDGFYAYRLNNGTFSEQSWQKYTSFNAWAVRAFLEFAKWQDDSFDFENYALKTLNFILNNLQDSTNKGFYHWVYRNGSIPNMGDLKFNDSVYQIGTYQSWVLLSLIDIFEYTRNISYINVWGNQLVNFLITKLWDSVDGGFYFEYLPFYDYIPNNYKYSWYQTWPALALMRYYEITNNETCLLYANRTLNFLITHLWNDINQGFVYRCLKNGTQDPTTIITLTDQAGAVLALSLATKITGNKTYWDNFLVPCLNFTTYYLWNDEFNQYSSWMNLMGTSFDSTMRPSDLSIWLFALSSVIDSLRNETLYKNLLETSLFQMESTGWDNEGTGFFRKLHFNGTILDSDKWTIEQVLPLFFLTSYITKPIVNYSLIYFSFSFFVGTFLSIIILYIKFIKPKKSTY